MLNEKDFNNVIGMLLSANVKKCLLSLEGLERDTWRLIFDDLIVNGRINRYEDGDLAILCKILSTITSEQWQAQEDGLVMKDQFWSAMTQRFVNLQADLNLRDFMTICNAFKVAHNLQDAAFVKYTEEKLWQ